MKIISNKGRGLAALLALGGLAGCGGGGGPAAPSTEEAAASVSSCGLDLEVGAPPRRAIALEQNATEIMLSLGLADHMIGTSYQTDPVMPSLADQYAQVPVLAAQYANHEATLAEEPDFLYSTLSSAYADQAAGGRADWAALGVPAYLGAFDCEDQDLVPGTVEFDTLFDEIEDVADVFDVEERGARLVDGLRQRLDDAVADAPQDTGARLMWYYSGTSTPYIAGQGGLPSTASRLLGVDNAFDDVRQKWPEGSWEEIAERDPDVIVLADLTRGGDGDSAEAKKRFLRTNPVTSQLGAVRNDRFLVVPGSAMDPSVRSVELVEAVSEGLRELYG
ncbi:ABC transporter substrate-binding protein [Streptomyces avicenniae]|uniref:ABC transporter substrate-binding protein n=1 Tax=Streptomyces avicenniae TaxID=500153 RepID=UPI0006998F91|nr:ABC transporter substrate-binding protein [Streptomyces avicenniae]